MFLNRLDADEKLAFLQLAHYIARSDNNFNNDEKRVIATYCLEMQINDIEYNESNFNFENILSQIQNKKSQNIIVMEVMALVYADHLLHTNEKKIIDEIVEAFSMSEAQLDVSKEWAKSILSLYAQGEAIIKL